MSTVFKSGALLSLKLWLIPLVLSVLLIMVSQLSFLAFHTLVELITIIISFCMFALAWSAKSYIRQGLLLYLACGYFWIGILDIIHTLVYKGMNIFTVTGPNLAVQYWLMARFLEALLLVSAPYFARRLANPYRLMTYFGLLTCVGILLIVNQLLPVMFIEGSGLTAPKIYSEYGIVFLMALAFVLFTRAELELTSEDKALILGSIFFTICAELAFTFYVSVYGLSNLVGHLFKLLSYWFIFHAVIVSNVKKPYQRILESEERFKGLFENAQVSIWNEDLVEVVDEFAKLKTQGVTDLEQYLSTNPDYAFELMSKVKVKQVNDATLALFDAISFEDFVDKMHVTFTPGATQVFIQGLIAIWNEESNFSAEVGYHSLKGREINAIISFQIPTSKEGFTNLPVSIIDITQQKLDEKRIQHQANYDSLTGLANRNLFFRSLSELIDKASTQQTHIGVLFVDLDRFKYVNDTLGHGIGDLLLQEASKRLAKSAKFGDVVARLGGDEFAILISDSHQHQVIKQSAVGVLEKLSTPYTIDGNDAFVSASIGISVYPTDGEDALTLLRKADTAMYQAKAKGRNNFQFFTMAMDVEALSRRELERRLRSAVENQELEVYYQPIMCGVNKMLAGCEALVRWKTGDGEFVPPDRFIPLAEEIGLIFAVSDFVVKQACKDAVNWPLVKGREVSLALNLSSREFERQDRVSHIAQHIVHSGIKPSRVTLEITESLLLLDDSSITSQLQSLRDLGINLAIDDFGTGYSSLSYLKKFPVNFLKIDRSFICNLDHDHDDRVLVGVMLSMAEALGLKVVAEGVEQASQLDFLIAKGCHYVQGYYYSKPLPNNEFIKFLRQSGHDEDAGIEAEHE